MLDLITRDDRACCRDDARAHQLPHRLVGNTDHADTVGRGAGAALSLHRAWADLIPAAKRVS